MNKLPNEVSQKAQIMTDPLIEMIIELEHINVKIAKLLDKLAKYGEKTILEIDFIYSKALELRIEGLLEKNTEGQP